MWPFTDAFTRGLRKCHKRYVMRLKQESPDDKTMDSICCDYTGFYYMHPIVLGELAGLIFAQAQLEGASRVHLHYGTNKMIYTISDVDYEMVPLPPPSHVDLVHALAKKSRTTWDKPGKLLIRFADIDLSLAVSHFQSATDPYIEISGFSGKPCIPCENAS